MAFWPLGITANASSRKEQCVSYQAEEIGVAVLQTGPVRYKARTHPFHCVVVTLNSIVSITVGGNSWCSYVSGGAPLCRNYPVKALTNLLAPSELQLVSRTTSTWR